MTYRRALSGNRRSARRCARARAGLDGSVSVNPLLPNQDRQQTTPRDGPGPPLEVRRANVSQHLMVLRVKDVVVARREGQNVSYMA